MLGDVHSFCTSLIHDYSYTVLKIFRLRKFVKLPQFFPIVLLVMLVCQL